MVATYSGNGEFRLGKGGDLLKVDRKVSSTATPAWINSYFQ